jgi:DDE family transposase
MLATELLFACVYCLIDNAIKAGVLSIPRRPAPTPSSSPSRWSGTCCAAAARTPSWPRSAATGSTCSRTCRTSRRSTAAPAGYRAPSSSCAPSGQRPCRPTRPSRSMPPRSRSSTPPGSAAASASPAPPGPPAPPPATASAPWASPRELHELEARNRAGQQDPAWHKRHAVRSGVDGTVCELARGHGMRHCRYCGQPKAHLQHVLTAIAVNIERLSQLPPGESAPPRPPTAFQKYLDQHDIKRLRSWRAVS